MREPFAGMGGRLVAGDLSSVSDWAGEWADDWAAQAFHWAVVRPSEYTIDRAEGHDWAGGGASGKGVCRERPGCQGFCGG